ncbi:MAG TPA: protein kinase [Candidatus Sulfotelmatobacter sp.]|nr:protein kinase [Candidatus Sulfotelmatobacter sp.]
MALTSGTKLGQYEILAPLGAGSMGEVYRARDARLNREVAIKVLPELASSKPDRLHRFELEARAAAALNHPNILAVYEMGTYQGMPYLVTELLDGKTLTECIRRGPLPLRTAIDYGIQIVRGLAAAHEKGIIHRDLKPDNLFVTKDGRVKILDFGLAKILPLKDSLRDGAPTVTLPGVAMGTVGYMSPEQVRGQGTDQRADIFAVGAILYEMATGERAFSKNTDADTISAILNEEPPSLSQLAPVTPLALDRVVRRCLEKNPEQRFHSASDLAFALEALIDPSLSSPSGAHRIPQAEPRATPPWIAAALSLLIVAAIVAYLLMRPVSVPKVANYVQLTHDGQQKTLMGTDGARLYLSLGEVRAGSFSSHGIAEMSISGGEPQKLGIMPSSDMIPVDISSDGSQLLAVDGQGAPPKGPLWSISILGGSPHRLADIIAETAAWSPDGKQLAYTILGDIFLAQADGTNSHKLTSVTGDVLNLAWSPDGRLLRFGASGTAGTVGQQFLWEVSTDGTGLHQLLPGWHDPPDECCGKWTADGKYFVFQSRSQIWALARKSLLHSDPKPVAITNSPLSLSSPLPGKAGKKLFVVGQTYRGELSSFDSKSGQMKPFLNGISAEYVDFSKDGQWVTYVSYREGTLWRSRADGSDRMQLTYPPMYPVLPRWSPDGKQILFFEFSLSPDKPARIYEISPDGGTPRPLLPDDHSQQLDPNFSPDGSKIVFAGESNDPASAIRVLDLSTHKISILPGSQGLYSPRWSPDGRFISALSADSKTLLLFDIATEKWIELAHGSLSWLNWSHDSQYVYVLDRLEMNAVVRIRIKDRKTEPVVDLKNFVTVGRYGGWLALTPDDSPILLRDTGSQDVYSVDWDSQ